MNPYIHYFSATIPVGTFAYTGKYVVQLGKCVGSYDDISEEYEYHFVSYYPYDIMRSTINSSKITHIFTATTEQELYRQFPELFI